MSQKRTFPLRSPLALATVQDADSLNVSYGREPDINRRSHHPIEVGRCSLG